MSQVITKGITDLAVTNAKVATGLDAAKIADGSVSNAEFQFINTLTSNVQTQLTGKASTTLNNLGTTSINADLLFDTNSTKNIGSLAVAALALYSTNVWTDVLSNFSNVAVMDLTTRQLFDSGTGLALDFNAEEKVILNSDQTNTAPRVLQFNDETDTASVSMSAPASLAGDVTFVLPPTNGTSGQVLRTNGAGVTTWVTVAAGETRAKETFVLNGTDITNQFITLSNAPAANSVHLVVKGLPPTLEGASYDYTITGAQIDFENDLATGGAAALIAGDIIQVTYEY